MLKADIIDRALDALASGLGRELSNDERKALNAAKQVVRELRGYEEPGR